MGVIQQGVNQAVALTAFGVSQNPTVKAKLEHAAEVTQSEKAAKKAHESLNSLDDEWEKKLNEVDWSNENATISANQINDIAEMQKIARSNASESYERAYKLNPTQENLENLYRHKQGIFNVIDTDNLLERMEQANQRAQGVKQAKVGQKRKFRDYLAKTQYSVGGHTGLIGDLPEKTQKLMAKTYSPSQRQKLMNSMDNEKKKKENK